MARPPPRSGLRARPCGPFGRARDGGVGSADEMSAVGDKVLFVVGHGDTTVHLHEEIAATRGGRIEADGR